MKFCYVDESGTGDEPYAVMVGVLVDALRMRPTKAGWDSLLAHLATLVGRPVDELHTRDFYSGNGVWRGIDGRVRTAIVDSILEWIHERKHAIAYAAVDKGAWHRARDTDPRLVRVATPWRFLGLHMVLAVQKLCQRIAKGKGNTVLVIDNEERERTRFTDLILNPPDWTDSYYGRKRQQDQLDQIVDAPYFADSRDVPLLQVADFVAYFLRRHLELENGGPERYNGERERVGAWAGRLLERAIPLQMIYPKNGRCPTAQLFFEYAPQPLRP